MAWLGPPMRKKAETGGKGTCWALLTSGAVVSRDMSGRVSETSPLEAPDEWNSNWHRHIWLDHP